MTPFNPNQHRARCEQYLSRCLGRTVRLIRAVMLEKSTRDAPWRLEAGVEGTPRSCVLRLASRQIEHEYEALRAMEPLPVPTPGAYGWDPEGVALGVACLFYDLVDGESLLGPMLAGEAWAEALYIDTACALQSITLELLPSVAQRFGAGETAADVLEDAYSYFKPNSHPLADTACARLQEAMPPLPGTRFSNGDLWPDCMTA